MSSPKHTVSGQVFGATEVRVNGRPAKLVGMGYTASVDLAAGDNVDVAASLDSLPWTSNTSVTSAGMHVLEATATDAAGRSRNPDSSISDSGRDIPPARPPTAPAVKKFRQLDLRRHRRPRNRDSSTSGGGRGR